MYEASAALALVRHPAVRGGAGRCYGQLDLPLADPADIAPIVAGLVRMRGAAIHTSPLARCRLVAEAVAKAWEQAPAVPDARLAEIDFGAWEGLAWNDVPRDALDAWARDLAGFAPPGGESGGALVARVIRFWRDLAEQSGRHVVITHGGPLKILAALADGRPPDLSQPARPFGTILFHSRTAFRSATSMG